MHRHSGAQCILTVLLLVLFLSACTTSAAPTAVSLAPTATLIPPTPSPVVVTDTPIPPSLTPSPTPTPTPTPTDTSVPPTLTSTVEPESRMPRVPTPTAAPATRAPVRTTSAPQVQMPASFVDTFDSPGFLKAGGNAICKLYYEGGQFHISVVQQNCMCWALYPRSYTDLTLEVDVTLYSGEGSCGGGADVVFGYRDRNNLDVLSVDRPCRGYGVFRIANGEWQDVRHWDRGLRGGPAPQPDMTVTHLKLVVTGTDFQLYSEGVLMDKVSDPSYQGGRVGLSGGTWGQDSHVSFDNFSIY